MGLRSGQAWVREMVVICVWRAVDGLRSISSSHWGQRKGLRKGRAEQMGVAYRAEELG